MEKLRRRPDSSLFRAAMLTACHNHQCGIGFRDRADDNVVRSQMSPISPMSQNHHVIDRDDAIICCHAIIKYVSRASPTPDYRDKHNVSDRNRVGDTVH